MKPSKDRPSTWVPYRHGLCERCQASCCTMPLEIEWSDLVRLKLSDEDEASRGIKKLSKRLMRAGLIENYRAATKKFMLARKSNGDCVFLNSISRKCEKYSDRPEVCRKFPAIGPRPGWCPANSKTP